MFVRDYFSEYGVKTHQSMRMRVGKRKVIFRQLSKIDNRKRRWKLHLNTAEYSVESECQMEEHWRAINREAQRRYRQARSVSETAEEK